MAGVVETRLERVAEGVLLVIHDVATGSEGAALMTLDDVLGLASALIDCARQPWRGYDWDYGKEPDS